MRRTWRNRVCCTMGVKVICGSRNCYNFILFSLQLKHIGLDFKARRATTTTEKSISTTDAAVFKYVNCNNLDISSG